MIAKLERVGIAVFGFCMSGVASDALLRPEATVGPPGAWIMLATASAVTSLLFALAPTPETLRAWTTTVLVLGVARSVSFAIDEKYAAPFVWGGIAVLAVLLHVQLRRRLVPC